MNDIIQQTIESLSQEGDISIECHDDSFNKTGDCQITIGIDKKVYVYYGEVKKEVRNHQLFSIIERASENKDYIIIADKIYPKVKEELRKNRIAYLELSGSLFIRENDLYLWIERKTPEYKPVHEKNRAFTKSGAKLLFYILENQENLQLSYRELSERLGVSLGSISTIFKSLVEQDYLRSDGTQYHLIDKQKLLDKWVTAYEEKLKPELFIGSYEMRLGQENTGTRYAWTDIQLKPGDGWSGEAGGYLLTKYLEPSSLILYTKETQQHIIKNYKLIPSKNGNIKIYRRFWEHQSKNMEIFPPLLVYADLLNTGEQRCIETAKIIYEKYLKKQF